MASLRKTSRAEGILGAPQYCYRLHFLCDAEVLLSSDQLNNECMLLGNANLYDTMRHVNREEIVEDGCVLSMS